MVVIIVDELIYFFFYVFKEKTKVDSTKGRYPEINNRVRDFGAPKLANT